MIRSLLFAAVCFVSIVLLPPSTWSGVDAGPFLIFFVFFVMYALSWIK